jgi:hypothetical protein
VTDEERRLLQLLAEDALRSAYTRKNDAGEYDYRVERSEILPLEEAMSAAGFDPAAIWTDPKYA